MRKHTLLPALLLAGCAFEPTTATTDQTIIGGELTSTADFPTVVALENGAGNWYCTGTLIDKDWVLTAAHCVVGEDPAALDIRFDDDDVGDGSGGQSVGVSEIHGHPGYNDSDWDNDIAVIKLATSVTDKAVTPIRREVVAPGTDVTQVGYGDADEAGGGSGVLRKLDTTTLDCAMANDATISGAKLLCFDGSDGTATCYGDSGGPTFLAGADGLEVVGVTSGGTEEACAAGWDLHTAVAAELDFIDMYVPHDPGDGGDGGNGGDGDDGGGDDDSGADSDDGGGCNAGGNASPLALLGVGLLALRRRRR